jgi:hypothetical protein
MRTSRLRDGRGLLLGAALLALISGCGGDEGGGGGGGGGGAAAPIDDSAAQLCVDTINEHRAANKLPPYDRWGDAEACANDEAQKDSAGGEAHGAFGDCKELAQNECPGWDGRPEEMIGKCLQQMWDEGPGDDFSKHGHYINMSSTMYTKVACGFSTLTDGKVWAVQDFK